MVFGRKPKIEMPVAPAPQTQVMGATQEFGQQAYPQDMPIPPSPQYGPQQYNRQPQKSPEQMALEMDAISFQQNAIYKPENFAMSDMANLLWAIYRKLCDLERKQ